jgi:hypothetical protein
MRRAFFLLALICAAIVAPAAAQQTVPPFRFGEQPVVEIPNIVNVMLAEPYLVNFWTFGDSSGGIPGVTGPFPSNQAQDSVASATAPTISPSPVPLNASTPTASPWPQAGAVGMVQDGSTAAMLTNPGAGAVFGSNNQNFVPATSGLLSELCNLNAGGACNQNFSIFCAVEFENLTGNYWFDADSSGTGLALGANMANGALMYLNGTLFDNFAEVASGIPYDWLYSFKASGTVSTLYLNGVKAEAVASPAPNITANSVTYFGSYYGGTNGLNGRLQDCALLDTDLQPSDAMTLHLALGWW